MPYYGKNKTPQNDYKSFKELAKDLSKLESSRAIATRLHEIDPTTGTLNRLIDESHAEYIDEKAKTTVKYPSSRVKERAKVFLELGNPSLGQNEPQETRERRSIPPPNRADEQGQQQSAHQNNKDSPNKSAPLTDHTHTKEKGAPTNKEVVTVKKFSTHPNAVNARKRRAKKRDEDLDLETLPTERILSNNRRALYKREKFEKEKESDPVKRAERLRRQREYFKRNYKSKRRADASAEGETSKGNGKGKQPA